MHGPLSVLLLLLLPFLCTSKDEEPPLLTAVPPTGFRCSEHPAGYYADMEAACQVYHMCDRMGRQFSYLCPHLTKFNQRFMVCDHWRAVACERSEEHYALNKRMAGGGRKLPQAGRMARLIRNNEIANELKVSNKISFKKINMRKLKNKIKNVISGSRSRIQATTRRTTSSHFEQKSRIKIGTVAGPRQNPASSTLPMKSLGTKETITNKTNQRKKNKKTLFTKNHAKTDLPPTKATILDTVETKTKSNSNSVTSLAENKSEISNKSTDLIFSELPNETENSRHRKLPNETEDSIYRKLPDEAEESKHLRLPNETEDSRHRKLPVDAEDPRHRKLPNETEDSRHRKLPNETEDSIYRELPDEAEDSKHLKLPNETEDSRHRKLPTEIEDSRHRKLPDETEDSRHRKLPVEAKDPRHRKLPNETEDSRHQKLPNETEDSRHRKLLTEMEDSRHRKEQRTSVANVTMRPKVTVIKMFPGMVARGSGPRMFAFPTLSNSVPSRKTKVEDFLDNPLYLELTRQILFMREGFVFPVRNIIGTLPQKIQNNSFKSKKPDGNTQFNIRDHASRQPISNFVINELHPVRTPEKPQTSLITPDLPTSLTLPNLAAPPSISEPESLNLQQLIPLSFSIPESQSSPPLRGIYDEIWTIPGPIVMRGPRQEQLTVLEATAYDLDPGVANKRKHRKPISITRLNSHAFYIPETKLAPPKIENTQHLKRKSNNLESHDSFYYR